MWIRISRLSVMLVFLFSMPAVARIYKCKDVDGNITYSQTTCVASSTQKQLSTSGAVNKPTVDTSICKLLGEAALEVYAEVKAGKPAPAVIDSYGGLNSINPKMLNLINYVGSFRAHDDISGQRVSQLSMRKCQAGGFGAVSIDDLQFRDPMLAQQASIRHQQQQVARQYAQELISVDFQQTPLPEALSMIASKAGVVFDIDPSVSGVVSLKMENVAWPQVLGRLAIEHKLLMGQGPNGVMISAMPNR